MARQSIYGTVNANGTFNISAVQHQGLYVTGATRIVFTGVVEKVIRSLGRVTVGGVNVDLVSFVPLEQSQGITVRALVQMAGLHPVAGGWIVAHAISGNGHRRWCHAQHYRQWHWRGTTR